MLCLPSLDLPWKDAPATVAGAVRSRIDFSREVSNSDLAMLVMGDATTRSGGGRRGERGPRARSTGVAVKTHPYMQVADAIRQRIGRGDYRPGDQLPSESQFCAEFGVSPMTLRRALARA